MSQLKQLITNDMKLALKAQDKSALKAYQNDSWGNQAKRNRRTY
jgi:hypothetical protein